MKYLTKKVLIIAIALSPAGLFSQTDVTDLPTATITNEYCVSLETDAPIAEYYEIDISHLLLSNELEAKSKFGYICNNLLTYEVNFSEEKVYLQIHLDRTPDPKDIIWWNEYMNSLCGL